LLSFGDGDKKKGWKRPLCAISACPDFWQIFGNPFFNEGSASEKVKVTV
jgi:hypothetical protein